MAEQAALEPTTHGPATKAGVEAAERLLRLAKHRWFGGRFPADGEVAVARLLLGAYLANARGDPIHKKAAAAVMGAEDVRTARKYVALAEEQGLLKAVPASDDRRKELLQPTALLGELVRQEFEVITMLTTSRVATEDRSSARQVGAAPVSRRVPSTEVASASELLSDIFNRELPTFDLLDLGPIEGVDDISVLEARIRGLDAQIAAGVEGGELYAMRGFSRMKLGDSRGAKGDFEKAVQLEPERGRWKLVALIALGECGLALGEYEEAKSALDDAYRMGPTEDNLYRLLCARALVNIARRDFSAVVSDLRLADKWQPSLGPTDWVYGQLYEVQGKTKRAIAHYRTASLKTNWPGSAAAAEKVTKLAIEADH